MPQMFITLCRLLSGFTVCVFCHGLTHHSDCCLEFVTVKRFPSRSLSCFLLSLTHLPLLFVVAPRRTMSSVPGGTGQNIAYVVLCSGAFAAACGYVSASASYLPHHVYLFGSASHVKFPQHRTLCMVSWVQCHTRPLSGAW